MKKIFFAFAMLFGSMVANASEIKLAKTAFDVVEGGTVVIPIQLNLTAAEDGLYKTFQLDAVLSNSDFSMESLAMAAERQTKADNQYDKAIAGKTIGIVGKLNAAVIQGTSGDFLYLTINAGAAASGDVCTITLSKVLGGNTAGVETPGTIASGSETITITVVDYVTIDENVDFTPAAMTKDVKLIRSFESGKFYTLILPFAANASKLAAAFGTAPTVYKFNGVTVDNDPIGKITLDFASSAGMAANQPYIIKVNADVTDPEFASAAIKAAASTSVSFTEEEFTFADVSFIGTYTPNTVVPAGALYLKSDDAKLYVSKGGTKMKGTRGYIDITGLGATFDVKNCVLALDGQETAIDAIDADLKAEGWFDLNGRKLAEKPATKGVYISNGKKVVVK